MKKLVLALSSCILMVWGAANAANAADGQVKAACQNTPTQCSQAKSTAKADAQKVVSAAKQKKQ